MIRDMPKGLKAYVEDTNAMLVREIGKYLDPRNPTTRAVFEVFGDLLELRATTYAMRSLDSPEPKEAQQLYKRALDELRDEILIWLELPQEHTDA